MPLSLGTLNLLKRLFPKQVEDHNTVKFPNIEVSLTDEQVEKLTQLFQAQLKFHHNNKNQASNLHLNSIVPCDRFLAKLWDERFENQELLSALVKIEVMLNPVEF